MNLALIYSRAMFYCRCLLCKVSLPVASLGLANSTLPVGAASNNTELIRPINGHNFLPQVHCVHAAQGVHAKQGFTAPKGIGTFDQG
jgi:hypothetical protein